MEELQDHDEWTAWVKPQAFFERILEARDVYRTQFPQCCSQCCNHCCTHVECDTCDPSRGRCVENLEFPTLCPTCEEFPFMTLHRSTSFDSEEVLCRIEDISRRIMYVLGEEDRYFGKFTWHARRLVTHDIENDGIGRWEERPEDDAWDLSDVDESEPYERFTA